MHMLGFTMQQSFALRTRNCFMRVVSKPHAKHLGNIISRMHKGNVMHRLPGSSLAAARLQDACKSAFWIQAGPLRFHSLCGVVGRAPFPRGCTPLLTSRRMIEVADWQITQLTAQVVQG